MILSIPVLSVIFSYAECHDYLNIMLSVAKLNVVKLSVMSPIFLYFHLSFSLSVHPSISHHSLNVCLSIHPSVHKHPLFWTCTLSTKIDRWGPMTTTSLQNGRRLWGVCTTKHFISIINSKCKKLQCLSLPFTSTLVLYLRPRLEGYP
jgi:hypothetical protein